MKVGPKSSLRPFLHRALQMNIDNFLVSSGWCTQFIKRNKLVLRQKTKISQRLPDDLEEKITSFQSFVIRARRSKNYSLVNIGESDDEEEFHGF